MFRHLSIAFAFCLSFALCPITQAEPIAYLTDVEGSWHKFESFMKRHEAFELGADNKYHLKSGYQFVFGGDAPDRFLGSLQVVEELVRLKEERPGSVVILSGNRDHNKVRFPDEISDFASQHEIRPVLKPAWDAWTDEKFLEEMVSGKISEGEEKGTRYNTAEHRLDFIMEKTMASPNALKLRREELAARQGVEPSEISASDVVESYRKEMGPGGSFRKMLKLSQLAYRRGNTLFVHSDVTPENIGIIPGKGRARSLNQWIFETNRWNQRQIQKWEKLTGTWDAKGPRPGETLLHYSGASRGQATEPTSLNYPRNVDADLKTALPPEEVVNELMDWGIQRLVVGHTPSGHAPVILRTADDQLEKVVGDNSYAPENFVNLITIKGAKGQTLEIAATVQPDANKKPIQIKFSTKLGRPSLLGKTTRDGAIGIAPVGDNILTYNLNQPGFVLDYQMPNASRFSQLIKDKKFDIANTTFILPANDGEAVEIARMLKAAGAKDIRISNQTWGARLDAEPSDQLRNLKETVVAIEMPSPELERKLREQGKKVFVVVDHHDYDGLERSLSESAIEQIAGALGVPLSRFQKGVGISDRSYIYGLIDEGYEPKEILEIRKHDLAAQGFTPEQFAESEKAHAAAETMNGVKVVRTPSTKVGYINDLHVTANQGAIKDILVLSEKDGVVVEANFSGSPENAKKLAEALGGWSGGDPTRSMFWGINDPNMEKLGKALNLEPLNIERQIASTSPTCPFNPLSH